MKAGRSRDRLDLLLRRCVAGSAAAAGARTTARLRCGKAKRGIDQGIAPLPGHDDLGEVQAHVDGIQQRDMHEEIAATQRQHTLDQLVGLFPEGMIAGKGGQPDQVLRGDGVRVRGCVIGGGAPAAPRGPPRRRRSGNRSRFPQLK